RARRWVRVRGPALPAAAQPRRARHPWPGLPAALAGGRAVRAPCRDGAGAAVGRTLAVRWTGGAAHRDRGAAADAVAVGHRGRAGAPGVAGMASLVPQ